MLGAKSDPVDALAKLAVALRTVQTTMVALFAHKHTEGGFVGVLRSTHPLLGLAALAVFAFGQALNAGIYHAIGKNGVYYGVKLGKTIPWATGFPFNVCGHPQYVGCVLTLWGAFAPAIANGPAWLALLPGLWSLFYVFSGIVESDGSKGAVPAMNTRKKLKK